MNARVIAEALIYLGVAGVLQFAGLAFAARQVQGIGVPRLMRRSSSMAVRHARAWAAVSSVVLVVGLTLAAALA